MAFAKVPIFGLLALAATMGTLCAAEVPVRFAEGVLHGFLLLRTLDGVQIAQGELFQVAREKAVTSRTEFLFNDGSISRETVAFTQGRGFTMQSYHLVQQGAVFPEDTEFSLERATGKYRVKTRGHKDGRDKVIEGTLDLPADVYNGMIQTIVKNLGEGAGETVHLVALTPKPRVIQLEITPADRRKVLIGRLERTALHYVLKPRLGTMLKLFATLLGRVPPDEHVWLVTEQIPAFVRFEGPLYMKGPVWRIELTSPRWPE